MNCFKNQSHEFLSTLTPSSPLYPFVQKIPKSIIDSLVSKYSFFVPGLFSGLALFVEEVSYTIKWLYVIDKSFSLCKKRRRPELAMYVLPKGLESLWIVATGKVGLKRWRGGESLLTAIGMAMVMVRLVLWMLSERVIQSIYSEHLSKRPPTPFRTGSKDIVSVYRTKLVSMIV